MTGFLLGSAFLLGLGSGMHCVGMCGPLVLAVPFSQGKKAELRKGLYFLGKALAYAVLGALVGLIGYRAFWGDLQQYLAVLSGLLILSLGLTSLAGKLNFPFPFRKQLTGLLQRMKMKARSYHFLSLGFLNGLLPCGMVYMALSLAIVGGGPLQGALVLFCFGMGTVPLLWAVTLMRQKVSIGIRQRFKGMASFISILIGLLLILRGLGLGLPYLSPHMNSGAPQAIHSDH